MTDKETALLIELVQAKESLKLLRDEADIALRQTEGAIKTITEGIY